MYFMHYVCKFLLKFSGIKSVNTILFVMFDDQYSEFVFMPPTSLFYTDQQRATVTIIYVRVQVLLHVAHVKCIIYYT
jgi:hypothetical protein